MSLDEKKNDNLDEPIVLQKKEFSGKCPYCGSKNVIYFGASMVGATTGDKLPSFSGEDWGCEDCKKIFKLI